MKRNLKSVFVTCLIRYEQAYALLGAYIVFELPDQVSSFWLAGKISTVKTERLLPAFYLLSYLAGVRFIQLSATSSTPFCGLDIMILLVFYAGRKL